jgi:hypothetical protein
MLANGVQETASAPGSATTINLAGPPTGRRGFLSAFATGAAVYYTMDDGTQFECGLGTVTAGSPNTLTRGTVLSNSSGTTSRLNFTGTTRVICTMLAERMGWVLAQAPIAVSAAAQQDILLPSNFRRFRLTYQGIRADAGSRNLGLRFSIDGGATFITTTSYTTWGGVCNASTGVWVGYSFSAAQQILLSSFLGSTGNATWSGEAEIFPGDATLAAVVDSKAAGSDNTTWLGGVYLGACAGSARVNALRVYTNTGTSAGTAAGSFTGALILEGLLN